MRCDLVVHDVTAADPPTPPNVYQKLVESIHDYAIYMLDLSGRVSSWNAGAQRFKGFTEDEILGEHFSRFYLPEDVANGRPFKALQTARVEGRFEDYAWRVRKNGERFWAHVVIDLIRDEHGAPMGFAKITRDITERREAESRLLTLRAVNQELQEFVHVASHDLREPLRKVLAFSDLLETEAGAKLDAEQRGYIRTITSATERMQSLLDSLLSLTKVSSHGGSFETRDLNQIVTDVISDLELAINERQATITVAPLPTLAIDPSQIRQLFQNLIENALKYSRPGVAPVVRINSVKADDPSCIAIQVSDNGLGFAPEHSDRIFGIFQRLHTRDEIAGSGVGLSICRKICERHGGTIRAHGNPGQGAAFTLQLAKTPAINS